MIRSVLVILFLLVFFIVSIPIFFIEWIISKFNPYAADISQLRIVQWAFKVILFLSGVRLEVIGEEHVPKNTAVLYIGNHRSYFDIVITYARCPGLTGYISKDSIEKVPLLSLWMKRLHCLFLNRDDVKEGLKVIVHGIEQIKNGISMCIFPEGTRSTGESELDMLPFKAGSLKMATKTNCPIIPMAITGSAEIIRTHIPRIKPAHVTLQYGEPIYPQELSREDQKHLNVYVQEVILNMLRSKAS